MKKRTFKSSRYYIIYIAVTALLIAASGIWRSAIAEDNPLASFNSNEEIRISSDNLTYDNEGKFAEFYGSVKASQGKDEIRADKLRVYLSSGIGEQEKKSSDEDAIEKIIAYGNVKIRFKDIIAAADEAVYKVQEQVLILNGKNSKVTRGNDSVSGAKITLNRVNGRINIEGAEKKRVEAVFYPGKKEGIR